MKTNKRESHPKMKQKSGNEGEFFGPRAFLVTFFAEKKVT